jgi:hypothetical protein
MSRVVFDYGWLLYITPWSNCLLSLTRCSYYNPTPLCIAPICRLSGTCNRNGYAGTVLTVTDHEGYLLSLRIQIGATNMGTYKHNICILLNAGTRNKQQMTDHILKLLQVLCESSLQNMEVMSQWYIYSSHPPCMACVNRLFHAST